jgi:molecular chaperone GrpE
MTEEFRSHSQEFTLNPSPPAEESSSSPADLEDGEDLRQALEEKTREAETNRDRALRAMADLDNYKKRVQREREEWSRAATESLIRQLLTVLDNFDRAIHAARQTPQPHTESLLAGVELIRRELLKVLESEGVTPYSAAGEPFDPEKHEAVVRVETTEIPEDMVVEELRRGYVWNGRVLRPAQVSVAIRPGSLEPESS